MPQDYCVVLECKKTRNIPLFWNARTSTHISTWGWILFVDQNLTGLESLLNLFHFVLFIHLFWVILKPAGNARRLVIWRTTWCWLVTRCGIIRDVGKPTKSCDRSGMLRKMRNEESCGKIWKVGREASYQRDSKRLLGWYVAILCKMGPY